MHSTHSLASQRVDKATRIAQWPHILCYDNINNISTSNFVEPRPSAPAKVQSGTFPILYELENVDWDDLRLEPMLRRARQATDLFFNTDIRSTKEQRRSIHYQTRIHIADSRRREQSPSMIYSHDHDNPSPAFFDWSKIPRSWGIIRAAQRDHHQTSLSSKAHSNTRFRVPIGTKLGSTASSSIINEGPHPWHDPLQATGNSRITENNDAQQRHKLHTRARYTLTTSDCKTQERPLGEPFELYEHLHRIIAVRFRTKGGLIASQMNEQAFAIAGIPDRFWHKNVLNFP
ncbi:hypothetical protein HD554DRAFT_2040423 [Boletus coccyginus]|nr:hypothetical protein HD554DRAFT_2040423 [Boletus coccyginus]